MDVDVAVVGAGPAGLSAAVTAGEAGCSVAVVDAYAQPGGQYFKQLPRQFHAARPDSLHHDGDIARNLTVRADRLNSLHTLNATTVWAAERPSTNGGMFTLHVLGATSVREVRANSVILAPGAYDRVLPFPGWDLPGVTTAGAVQTLVKSQRVLPGQRVLLAGSGPFLLPVAAGLVEAGARVVAVCEATRPLWSRPLASARLLKHASKLYEGFDYLRVLVRNGVPMKYGYAVTEVIGQERAATATIRNLSEDWEPRAGHEERLSVDWVGVGFGFMPANELSFTLGCAHTYDSVQGASFVSHNDYMETSVPGILVAGEITGIRGSAVALLQGSIAGMTSAFRLGHLDGQSTAMRRASLRRAYARRLDFASTLIDLFAVRPGWMQWLTPETIICRCEEVPFGEVRDAVERRGARDVSTVKSLTRCGMGPCQGRMCGYAVTAITAHLAKRAPAEVGALTPNTIVRPTPLGEILSAGTEH